MLSYLLLIPMIKFFGDLLTVPVSPGTMLIRDMTANDIRSAYVLYIGSKRGGGRWPDQPCARHADHLERPESRSVGHGQGQRGR
ncbi:hypothetical protein LP419_01020 [Massilia sp. H-1]|nr:hypothetical protein LP419_01020 [Massilia sp. H-1]